MQIAFDGRLTRRDYRRAFGLYLRQPAAIKVASVLLGGVVLLAAAVRLGMMRYRPLADPLLWPGWAVVTGSVLIAWPWWKPCAVADELYKPHRKRRTPTVGHVGPEGIRFASSGGQSDWSWPAFASYQLAPGMILLQAPVGVLLIFVRSEFGTDGEWEAFGGLVELNVPKASPAGRTGRPSFLTEWAMIASVAALCLLVLVRGMF